MMLVSIDFLCDIRLVMRVHVGKQTYYEIAGAEPHHHLICRHCGHEIALSNQMVEWFFVQIKQRYQFGIDHEHLTLFGTCAYCQQPPSTITHT